MIFSRFYAPRRFIYAALAPDIHEVKFGVSAAPEHRVVELASAKKTRVILVAQIPGDHWNEKRWLRRGRGYRLDGEWFRECPEILRLVSEMMFIQQVQARQKADAEGRRKVRAA